MDNPKIIKRCLELYENVIISIVTIEELDNLKDSKDISKSKSARKALREIDFYLETGLVKCDMQKSVSGCLQNDYSGFNQNDNVIISQAVKRECDLYTLDYGMKAKMKALDGKVCDFHFEEEIYKGYKEFNFTTDEYNDFFGNKEQHFKDFVINEYLIINRIEENESDEYRFDGQDFVRLKLPASKVLKGKNSLQRCAMDMLNNPEIPICAILGTFGSGKTFLSLRMGMNSIHEKGIQSKLLGVREPIGEGEKIGYLKGDFEDKTKLFFLPLVQSLEGGEQDFQRMIDSGQFDSTVPFYMKGTTYDDTIIICDEAEDLTDKRIKLVGTRLGENSRIFFSGDYHQGIFDDTVNNPLVRMCQSLKGNPKFACVFLEDDVRSEASKIFANM